MKQKNQIFRFKQFDVRQEHAAMKVGTDSDLLGALAAGGNRILDVGTGTGVLSLIMAQRFPEAQLTAVEIDENAIIDAKANFENSRFRDRIMLRHTSFQDFLASTDVQKGTFDCVICNPPYFDKSLECPDLGRSRARHSSSLPFSVLAQGVSDLLCDGGVFTVCIPPEVLKDFNDECLFAGLWQKETYQIKSVPEKGVKRYVIVYRKGGPVQNQTHTFCMRNSDHSVSEWYKELMSDYLL